MKYTHFHRLTTISIRVASVLLPVLVFVFAGGFIAQAGALFPSALPAATGYTLSDIYTRLTTNATAVAHAFTPAGAPGSTFYTLSDIYNSIPTINPAKVLSDTPYLGITGTYNASLLASSTVKNGTAFGVGLTGNYPSATYKLPSADGTTDLAASASNITSDNGSVQWWQSDGTRQTATLDFPTLANVCSSDTSNNSAGTLSITAASVASSASYCGVTGTLLGNMFNGTSGAFTGGSQTNGGADDYNAGGAAATGRYTTGWTSCVENNDYCNTDTNHNSVNDSGADARDDSTNLIWSLPCKGAGCDSFSDSITSADQYAFSTTTGAYNFSTVQNAYSTASGLCTNGDHAISGWFLPHQKQLMQAYIDGSYGANKLETAGVGRYYWSASAVSGYTTLAWYTSLSTGLTDNNAKIHAFYVRCVRPAI